MRLSNKPIIYGFNGLLSDKEVLMTAIAATYSMVGAAMGGADKQTQLHRIAFSDEVIHGYQMRALGRSEKKLFGLFTRL